MTVTLFKSWSSGWLILGTTMTIFSFFIASFPKQLKPNLNKGNRPINSHLYEMVPINEIQKITNTESKRIILSNPNVEEGFFSGLIFSGWAE